MIYVQDNIICISYSLIILTVLPGYTIVETLSITVHTYVQSKIYLQQVFLSSQRNPYNIVHHQFYKKLHQSYRKILSHLNSHKLRMPIQACF